ncbi:hypothetical protein LY78DRAFT_433635 [Colletotrichum sublineola]|nr:hypothetical protein LY78DRAFT_433635 [Colletotrichum sublineola]
MYRTYFLEKGVFFFLVFFFCLFFPLHISPLPWLSSAFYHVVDPSHAPSGCCYAAAAVTKETNCNLGRRLCLGIHGPGTRSARSRDTTSLLVLPVPWLMPPLSQPATSSRSPPSSYPYWLFLAYQAEDGSSTTNHTSDPTYAICQGSFRLYPPEPCRLARNGETKPTHACHRPAAVGRCRG